MTETIDLVRHRRWRRSALMLAVGLALIVWLLWEIDLRELGRSLSGASLGLVLLGILGNQLTPWLRAMRLKQAYGVKGSTSSLTGMMGQYGLVNLVMPLHTGDVALLMMLKGRGVIPSIAEGLPRWILLRATDLGAVLVLVVVTAMVVPMRGALAGWTTLACLGLVVGGAAAASLVLLSRWSADDTSVMPAGFFRGRLWALRRGLRGIGSVAMLLPIAGWSLAIWTWQATMVAIEYSAFQLALPATDYWGISVGVLGLSVLPIHAPLGIGTLHAAQRVVLAAFGVQWSEGVGAAVGIHAAMLLTIALQGVLGTALLALAARRATPQVGSVVRT